MLENDLAQLTPDVFEAVMDKIDRLIVLDALDNRISSASNLVFPAATFAEGPGTFINNEGTAQRAYAVFHSRGPDCAFVALAGTDRWCRRREWIRAGRFTGCGHQVVRYHG
ncbi:MAG: hypothetical protein U5O39_05805 [Gammaproteobacteria bacterium]|nr:hypothetical protein [Gammaproteobacteria bacterium]